MTATAGRRESFGASTWIHRILRDEQILDGNARGVALAIAGQIRWASWELQPAFRTLAERLDVTEEFCRDLIAYLVGLGYLVDAGESRKRRAIYVPALPKVAHSIMASVPTNEDSQDLCQNSRLTNCRKASTSGTTVPAVAQGHGQPCPTRR